jgi:hypothetical protein
LATTDAPFAGNVEGKVSNPLAHLPAARSFVDRTKLAAGDVPNVETSKNRRILPRFESDQPAAEQRLHMAISASTAA